MNVTTDAYYFIIDENNPPGKLSALELSFQPDKKTPEEVYKTFNYCQMVTLYILFTDEGGFLSIISAYLTAQY